MRKITGSKQDFIAMATSASNTHHADRPNDSTAPSLKRERNGRFAKGASGNPCGRPRTRPKMPKTYVTLLAEILARKVAVTNADGKRRAGSELERIAENIVTQLSKAKPREALDVLERLRALEVFDLMRWNAGVDLDVYIALARESLRECEALQEPYDPRNVRRDHSGRPI